MRVDPQACLTDVLARIGDHKITRLDELLPWRYAKACWPRECTRVVSSDAFDALIDLNLAMREETQLQNIPIAGGIVLVWAAPEDNHA